jgi:hypothetical protein
MEKENLKKQNANDIKEHIHNDSEIKINSELKSFTKGKTNEMDV